jgi:hypothetical protein
VKSKNSGGSGRASALRMRCRPAVELGALADYAFLGLEGDGVHAVGHATRAGRVSEWNSPDFAES